jgi:hypothetical protein
MTDSAGEMSSESVFTICERVAEVQALLHDHLGCGKHSATEVVAKMQAVLSESELLRAMSQVGYFQASIIEWNGGSAV